MWGVSLVVEDLLASQEGLCSLEFASQYINTSTFSDLYLFSIIFDVWFKSHVEAL
jgi:hypothetical protein